MCRRRRSAGCTFARISAIIRFRLLRREPLVPNAIFSERERPRRQIRMGVDATALGRNRERLDVQAGPAALAGNQGVERGW